MNWSAMGLAHLQPFQPCFVIGPTSKKTYPSGSKHKALYSHQYTAASALCDTPEEREELKRKTIAAWEKEQILRVNKSVDMSVYSKRTNSGKAAR